MARQAACAILTASVCLFPLEAAVFVKAGKFHGKVEAVRGNDCLCFAVDGHFVIVFLIAVNKHVAFFINCELVHFHFGDVSVELFDGDSAEKLQTNDLFFAVNSGHDLGISQKYGTILGAADVSPGGGTEIKIFSGGCHGNR